VIYTAKEKLDAVQREIRMRRRVYPRRVSEQRMTQQLADREIAVMEAVAKDYEDLAVKERLI
jgi:hypothetical protein